MNFVHASNTAWENQLQLVKRIICWLPFLNTVCSVVQNKLTEVSVALYLLLQYDPDKVKKSNKTYLKWYNNNNNNNNNNNHKYNYVKILESDWSSAGLISAVILQLHTSCACDWTVVCVMPE